MISATEQEVLENAIATHAYAVLAGDIENAHDYAAAIRARDEGTALAIDLRAKSFFAAANVVTKSVAYIAGKMREYEDKDPIKLFNDRVRP